MDPSPLLQLALSRADDWRWVGGAFAVALALRFLPRIGPAASGLLLPTGLLLLRKLLLFLPIPGALSTEDRVFFWSVGAAVYFVFLSLYLLAGAVVVGSGDTSGFDGEGCPWLLLLPAIGSWILLPIDGFWSHLLVTPFVCATAIPKVLLVHPLLLPVALAGLAGQLCLTLFWGGHGAREINKLLLGVLLAVGLVSAVSGIATVGKGRAVLDEPAETTGFLGAWAGSLDGIAECGANLVDGNHQNVYGTCRVREMAEEMAAARSAPFSLPAVLAGAALGLLVLAVVERVRWPGRWRGAPWSPGRGTGSPVGEEG